MSNIVPLNEAQDDSVYGGKSVHLGIAVRAGLPVPGGYALSYEFVEAIVLGDKAALNDLRTAFDSLKKPVAARSSAIGEDSEGASFAGQHLSVLNVMAFDQLVDAVTEVVESALTSSAQSYRERLGVEGAPRMGIVLQELFNPVAAGVLFTRNPLDQTEERVVEAAWGLGEVVVAGLVIPDYYRVSPDGEILECRIGDKDLALQMLPEGGTEEIELPEDKATTRILSDEDLQNLHQLALSCEAAYGEGLDIEWGLDDERLVLLQCRAITTVNI
ncbi:MAG: PEP/pyruvate-binding domain-containing protein [Pseudomonadota bacterium]